MTVSAHEARHRLIESTVEAIEARLTDIEVRVKRVERSVATLQTTVASNHRDLNAKIDRHHRQVMAELRRINR